jgi:hypothetical protein
MKSINESQGSDLLLNMYKFYSKRYASNPSEIEKKFNAAVEDLITTGDIKNVEYIDFCVTHDIEPKIKEKKQSSSSSSSDPCGHSVSYRGC